MLGIVLARDNLKCQFDGRWSAQVRVDPVEKPAERHDCRSTVILPGQKMLKLHLREQKKKREGKSKIKKVAGNFRLSFIFPTPTPLPLLLVVVVMVVLTNRFRVHFVVCAEDFKLLLGDEASAVGVETAKVTERLLHHLQGFRVDAGPLVALGMRVQPGHKR